MPRVCDVTGKKGLKGNLVSHANNKTRRIYQPNLHYRRFWVETQNRWVRLRVIDGQGRSMADVQLPVGVLKLFIRMGARWLPALRALEPDVILAAVQLRRGGRLFEAVDETYGDRVEITLE